MVDQRLLTLGEDTVEVTHEALLRAWPRLRQWLEADVEGRKVHHRLEEAARELGRRWPRPVRPAAREPPQPHRGMGGRPRRTTSASASSDYLDRQPGGRPPAELAEALAAQAEARSAHEGSGCGGSSRSRRCSSWWRLLTGALALRQRRLGPTERRAMPGPTACPRARQPGCRPRLSSTTASIRRALLTAAGGGRSGRRPDTTRPDRDDQRAPAPSASSWLAERGRVRGAGREP